MQEPRSARFMAPDAAAVSKHSMQCVFEGKVKDKRGHPPVVPDRKERVHRKYLEGQSALVRQCGEGQGGR